MPTHTSICFHSGNGWITPKFPLGAICATPSALASLTHDDILAALRRHIQGDWGEADGEDRRANERALDEDGRLVSVYSAGTVRFYVITEWDRSLTTILLPQDY